MRAHTSPWYLVLSSYWFASSFKWFLILLVLLPSRVAELAPDSREAALGFLFALGAVMAFFGPPVWGYISDRVARRMPFLAVGSVLTAAALVWMAYAGSYWQLVAAYILLQAADDIATGPYSALIPDLAAKRERGEASGWLGALQLGGNVMAGVVGIALAASPQWQFLTIAVVTLLAAILILTQIREVPGLKPQRRDLLASLVAPWQNADFRWVWFTRFLVMFAQYGVQTYLQYYLADVVRTFEAFGRTLASGAAQAVAILGLLISLGAAFSAIPSGQISDRIGRKRMIYYSGVGLAVLMLPILLLPRFDVLLVVALMFGALYGAYVAVDWALVSDVLPNPTAHATDMGIWQTSIVLPQVLAGSMGALIGGLNTQSPGSGYTVLFLLAAVCFVLGTVLVRQIRGAR